MSSERAPTLLYSLYIINKAGGLIYQKDFCRVPKRSTNDYLRLASTFHSLHAITARGIHIDKVQKGPPAPAVTPQGDTLPKQIEGIQTLEAKDFRLQCYQTLTGTKFLIISSPNFTPHTLDKLLQQVYLIYADQVLKNPFYELEMPIRLESFDLHLQKLIQQAMGASAHNLTDRRDK